MKKKLFLLALALSGLNAQTIQSINFKGLIHLSPDVATQIMGLKVGQELTPKLSDKAITNLYKQNYFDDIYIEDTGSGNLLVKVKEKPSVARVDLKGVVTNDKTAIESLINIKPGNMYDELTIEKTKERIRQYYESKGYFDTVVDVEKQPVADNDSSLFITLNINRGENMIIKKVNLVGAKEFDYDDIEPVETTEKLNFSSLKTTQQGFKINIFKKVI